MTGLFQKGEQKFIFVASGLDPSGKAGFIRDIDTITAIGGYAGGVITALTVQDFQSAHKFIPVDASFLRQQIDVVWKQRPPDAVKIGMVPNLQVANVIAEILKEYRRRHKIFVVWDPVFASSDNFLLTEESQFNRIFLALAPMIDVLTPNLPEFQRIFGVFPEEDKIALVLKKFHISGIVVKGGHSGDSIVKDTLIYGEITAKFVRPKISVSPRGTGCTFSSALATFYAFSQNVVEAFEKTEKFMDQFLVRN